MHRAKLILLGLKIRMQQIWFNQDNSKTWAKLKDLEIEDHENWFETMVTFNCIPKCHINLC